MLFITLFLIHAELCAGEFLISQLDNYFIGDLLPRQSQRLDGVALVKQKV